MKNLKLTFALAAFAAAILTASAASSHPAPTFGELPVPQVAARVAANGDHVAAGTTRVFVSLRLGAPNHVLPDGTWLYSNYVMRLSADDAGRPATLVVRFRDNRVTQLTLADSAAVLAMRNSPHRVAPDRILTAAAASR